MPTYGRIYREEFNEILRGKFSDEKRAVLNDLFSDYLSDGLDEARLRNAVTNLKYNRPNGISSEDLDKVAREVSAKLAPKK